MKKFLPIFVFAAFFVFSLTGCNGDAPKDNPIVPPNKHIPLAQFVGPANNDQFIIGEVVQVEIKINSPEGLTDLALFVEDTLFAGDLSIKDQSILISTDSTSKVGWTKLVLSYKDSEGNNYSDTRKIVFFSDFIPVRKSVVILNTYPHEKGSYTQGLEFYQGKLYEGTGQYNRSVLAEVELTSGSQLRKHDLDGSIFGEGITILNDTIFQISYRAETCFMYDMSFNQIGQYGYDGEGWGLCNDGENLIMSNGDSEIVWRNPGTFEIVKSIQVFDNEQSVENLNELELINGRLYVNIYQDSKLAVVDTLTGKVLEYIECQNLVSDAQEIGNDVLNGIAHNPQTGKTYLTGKLWPKLYEVKFE